MDEFIVRIRERDLGVFSVSVVLEVLKVVVINVYGEVCGWVG